MAGIWNPFRNAQAQQRRAAALSRGLMEAALSPEAYAAGIVPDDMDHRVQMVSLHAAVLVWQLTRRPEKVLQRLPKLIHAHVFDGFDASFRETGVGDASIARKVRKVGEHYYGLGTAAADCLSRPENQRICDLAALLNRNRVTAPGGEEVLARYLATLSDTFDAQPSEAFLAGDPAWLAFPATHTPGVANI